MVLDPKKYSKFLFYTFHSCTLAYQNVKTIAVHICVQRLLQQGTGDGNRNKSPATDEQSCISWVEAFFIAERNSGSPRRLGSI